MKKRFQVVSFWLAGILLGATPVCAEPDAELLERIVKLEEKLKEGTTLGDWAKRISLSGLVEVEAGYENTRFTEPGMGDEDSSDLSLATVELGADVDVIEHVSGHVLFLYEDGEDLSVDEGFIRLDGGNALPLYLQVGEMYVPFGKFESRMISDPLTLELGETRETAAQVGFRVNGVYGSIYVFNGDIDKDDDDSHIDNYGANLGYTVATETFGLDLGVSWINNVVDSDGYSDVVDEEAEEADENGFAFAFRDYVPGIGAHTVLTIGPATLIGEYVALLEKPEWRLYDVEPGSLAALGLESRYKGEKIAAWNLELGYAFALYGKETTVAVAYQGSKDAEDWLPEERYLGSVGVGIFDATTLALEYRHDEFETDDEADGLTAQLAVEF